MKNKQEIIDKYTICGLWVTMSASIVLLCIKGVLAQNFLVNFYIDTLVGIIAFYVMIHNIKTQFGLLKEKTAFIVQIVSVVVGIVLTVLTCNSPFDFSFLILVIGMIVSRKIFIKQL
jgi:hypothetical protein